MFLCIFGPTNVVLVHAVYPFWEMDTLRRIYNRIARRSIPARCHCFSPTTLVVGLNAAAEAAVVNNHKMQQNYTARDTNSQLLQNEL